jgi:hypothetical protein
MSNGKHEHEALYHRIPHHQKPFDPTMFRPVDIFEGQELLFLGWTARDTRWRVVKIKTDLGYGRGPKVVKYVQHVSDIVELEPLDERMARIWDLRELPYSYIEGSSRWRTIPEYKPADARKRAEIVSIEVARTTKEKLQAAAKKANGNGKPKVAPSAAG